MIANIAQAFEPLCGGLIDVINDLVLRHGETGGSGKSECGENFEEAIHDMAQMKLKSRSLSRVLPELQPQYRRRAAKLSRGEPVKH